MPDKTAYEHGPDKRVPKSDDDPNDDFSQDAAKNRKPPLGTGLTEKVEPRKRPQRPDGQQELPEHDDHGHPTRDTRETPSENPNGNSDGRD